MNAFLNGGWQQSGPTVLSNGLLFIKTPTLSSYKIALYAVLTN